MEAVSVKAFSLLEGPGHRPGRCESCGERLRALFGLARGRDAARDEESFFLDRFCSHGCYHAYGRRVASKAAVRRWN